jgi:hypothetical protein
MRIQGRLLRPQNLAERRILKSLGLDFVRVPRRLNPYAVARLVRRMSFGGEDMRKVKHMLRIGRPQLLEPSAPQQPTLPDSTSTFTEQSAA